MAIGLVMQFKGDLGSDKYDAIMRELGLMASGGNWPDGIVSHVAGATAEGWCVVDVWQSQDHFDRFFAARLKPAFDKVGDVPQPAITPFEVHLIHQHG
jgi:hypothetical protein